MNTVLFDTCDRYLKVALFYLPSKEAASGNESVQFSRPKIFFEKLEISEFDGFYGYWDRLMESAGIKTSNLQYIFVNRGPGSFIGLRLSVMVAKTLAYLTKASLYGFDSFDMLLEGLGEKSNGEKNIYLMIKPMFRSNFFFTLVEKSVKLSEIKKLEISSDGLNRLLVDGKNKLRSYLTQHFPTFDKNEDKKIYTVAYKLKNDLEQSPENWEANVDVLVDYNQVLFEQFIGKIISQFDGRLGKVGSIGIGKISSAFELTPIYV